MIVDPDLESDVSPSLLFELEADITESGTFESRFLRVSSDRLVVDTGNGKALHEIELDRIENAWNESVASGGHLKVRLNDGSELVLISYSVGKSGVFGEAARGITQLAGGQDLSINLDKEREEWEADMRSLVDETGTKLKKVKRGRNLLRLTELLGPYKLSVVLLVMFSTLATLMNLIPPRIQGYLVDGLTTQTLTSGALIRAIALWGGAISLAVLFQVFANRTITYLGTHISEDLRAKTFRALEFLKLNYFDRRPVGAIAARVTQDTDRVWHFLVDALPFFATNILLLIGVSIYLFVTDALLATAILLPLPLIAVVSAIYWKPMSNYFHKVSQKIARLHMHLTEALTGIRVIKAFVREDHEFFKFSQRNKEWQQAAMIADQRWYTIFGITSLLVASGALINWSVGGYFVLIERLTLGQFITINAYLIMVYGPLQFFASVNNWFSRAMAGAERIYEVIDTEPEVAKREGKSIEIEGRVEFVNVRFGYDKSNPVIKGLSFEVQPGEMIGLVGPSGAGKSTTINMIGRFYEPDAGAIKIDGIDYRELDLHSYRSQIGIVLQEPFLFSGTISENIAYGKPEASFEEIMQAARAANAHEFISAKPEGYDTMVGERGARLSGGERQRISIARAILHDPRILILDEATSSVDVETEREIQEAISRLTSGRTTFAIAHRLSTLRNASRLIVLENGEIAEVGTHQELMEKKGVFHRLVTMQSQINEIIGVSG